MNNYYVEYKNNYSYAIANTICGFLNSHDGTISITIEHSDGDIILRGNMRSDLEDRLWAFSLDEEDNLIDIKTDNQKVIYDNVSYYFILEDENVWRMVVNVIKPNNDNLYFCVRRNVKGPSGKANEKVNMVDDKWYAYDFYFRVGNRNVKSDNVPLSYLKKIKKFGFPHIRDYVPADYNAKKEFIEIRDKNKLTFQVIGEFPHGNYFYKYMDLESALRCLERRKKGSRIEKRPNIRFVEPTSWDDQYEGRFYNACYMIDDGKGNLVEVDPINTPFLYACCFSSKRENEAAWVLYSHNRTGLASRCVEFTLNRMRLREELVKNLNECTIYIGVVNYEEKSTIDCIHQSTIGKDNRHNENYNKYFDKFSIECYLNLLLLKRYAFEHEKEVRLFIIPNDEIKNEKSRRGEDGKFSSNKWPKSRLVDIDWINIIEEIKIDKNCTEVEESLLQNRLDELVRTKKKDDHLTKDEFEKLKLKVQLKKFDPYKDESLEQGPITIVTN